MIQQVMWYSPIFKKPSLSPVSTTTGASVTRKKLYLLFHILLCISCGGIEIQQIKHESLDVFAVGLPMPRNTEAS